MFWETEQDFVAAVIHHELVVVVVVPVVVDCTNIFMFKHGVDFSKLHRTRRHTLGREDQSRAAQ